VGSVWFLALTRAFASYGVDRLVLLVEALNVYSVSQKIYFQLLFRWLSSCLQ